VKWTRGSAVIGQLLAEGRLERITGAAADGSALQDSADGLLASARRELERNPEAAFILAYDAARKSATGLLAQQGLRPKAPGHHLTVEAAVRAQFGGPFDAFGGLRRRRGEIEYPRRPGDDVIGGEAEEAVDSVERILAAARKLIDALELYV
jgi:HEPN domain-containing protein